MDTIDEISRRRKQAHAKLQSLQSKVSTRFALEVMERVFTGE